MTHPSPQTTSQGHAGEAGRRELSTLPTPRAARAGNTIALSVASVAFAVACVLSVAVDVEQQSCASVDPVTGVCGR